MSAEDDEGVTVTPPERYAIGLSFGNSNSSIAHTSGVCLQVNAEDILATSNKYVGG